MADDDDATMSPLFTYLRVQLPELLERAQDEGWKVAVPKASSLRGVALSQALVESHLLRQGSIRDELTTANGRIVAVKKDPRSGSVDLVAGKGFPTEGVAVRVISEDLWYGPSSDMGLQLVHVSDLLEGDRSRLGGLGSALDGASSRGGMKEGYTDLPGTTFGPGASAAASLEAQWLRDQEACLEYIRSLKGAQLAFQSLERRVSEFRRSYVLARGYEDETAGKILTFATEFAEGVEGGSYEVHHAAGLCYCLHALHSKLWASLKRLHGAGDARAAAAMNGERKDGSVEARLGDAFLGFDFGRAAEAFAAMREMPSPVLKLQCVSDAQAGISMALDEGRRSSSVTVFAARQPPAEGYVLGMDELLPLFLHVVAQSGLEDLVTSFKYVRHFAFDVGPKLKSKDFLIRLFESTVKVFA